MEDSVIIMRDGVKYYVPLQVFYDYVFDSAPPPPVYDVDAQNYITAVEAADGQPLEVGVKDAINTFVVGCKTDGVWSAIKQCNLLCGARTLPGALVPLVGNTPTNFNFVSADYNRKTGLKGNGTNKNLVTSYAISAGNQNNAHASAFMTEVQSPSTVDFLVGDSTGLNGIQLGVNGTTTIIRTNGNSSFTYPRFTGFMGVSRANSTSISRFYDGTSDTFLVDSTAVTGTNITIFSRISSNFTIARLAFYSVGEALNLVALRTRVLAYRNNIDAIIP